MLSLNIADRRLPWLSVLGLAVAATAVLGQDGPPTIPMDVRNAPQITDEHRKKIDTYFKYWVDQMLTGTRAAVAEAKDKMATVLETNPPKPFREVCSEILGKTLAPAMEHKSAQVRISAMLVASNASTGAVADLCGQGLADANAGVRYHAAKAVADILERRDPIDPPPITEVQQRKLLTVLKAAMTAEKSELVFQQMGRAVSRLTLDEAFKESLVLLDERIAWVRSRPEEYPRAAKDIIANLAVQLVAAQVAEKNIDQQLRDLATAAGRYLAVLAERIEAEGVMEDTDHQQAWGDLIEVIDADVLKRAVEKLAPGVQGPSLSRRVTRREWGSDTMGSDIKKWIGDGANPGLLSSSAIKIDPAKLQLPPLESPATAPVTPAATK